MLQKNKVAKKQILLKNKLLQKCSQPNGAKSQMLQKATYYNEARCCKSKCCQKPNVAKMPNVAKNEMYVAKMPNVAKNEMLQKVKFYKKPNVAQIKCCKKSSVAKN